MNKYLTIALVLATAAITHIAFAPPVSAHIAQSYNIYIHKITNHSSDDILWYEPVPKSKKMRTTYNRLKKNFEVLVNKKINQMPYTINVRNKTRQVRSIDFNLVPEGSAWELTATIRDRQGRFLDMISVTVDSDNIYNANIIVGNNGLNITVIFMSHEQIETAKHNFEAH